MKVRDSQVRDTASSVVIGVTTATEHEILFVGCKWCAAHRGWYSRSVADTCDYTLIHLEMVSDRVRFPALVKEGKDITLADRATVGFLCGYPRLVAHTGDT